MGGINRYNDAINEAISLGNVAVDFQVMGEVPVRMLYDVAGNILKGASPDGTEGMWLFRKGMAFKIPKSLAEVWGKPKDSLNPAVCEILTIEQWGELFAKADMPRMMADIEAGKEQLIKEREAVILRRQAVKELKKEGKI